MKWNWKCGGTCAPRHCCWSTLRGRAPIESSHDIDRAADSSKSLVKRGEKKGGGVVEIVGARVTTSLLWVRDESSVRRINASTEWSEVEQKREREKRDRTSVSGMKRRGKLGEEESKRKEGSWMIFPVDVHAFLYEQFRVISFIYNRGGGNFKSDAKHELEIFFRPQRQPHIL